MAISAYNPNTATFMAKKGDLQRQWHLIDVKDQVLGRVSTHIAKILSGKTKPTYTPSLDCGDFVVAVNVNKMKLTGKKLEHKSAFYHSAHPGGGRRVGYKKLMPDNPEKALYRSVKRMLPKNKLASRQILRLKMYQSDQHKHLVQNPIKEMLEK
jgi:large subunit ribosomal protein L13